MGIFFITFSYLLLAAHALRGGDWGLVVFMLGCASLVLIRERWVGYVTSAVLCLGAFMWVNKGADLLNLRINTGGDWTRLILILGALFALTLFSAAFACSRSGHRVFKHNKEQGWFKASIFLITALLLEITRSKVSFPILLADRFFPGWGRAEIFLLAIYAVWVGGKMFAPAGSKKMRPLIWALFSLVFFGQLAIGLAGADNFLMTGNLHLPVPALIAAGPVFRGSGFFMPVLFTVSALLVGPAWCSHLCYIGAWDDLCSRISKKRPSTKFSPKLIWLRAILLVIVVGTAWGMRASGVSGYTAVWLAAGFGLLSVFIMIYFSRKMGMMVHCTAFCPMGILSNLLGKLSPWRMRISSECCKCMKCSTACRYGALTKFDIDAARPGLSCTLCGDCISSCSGMSIGYKLPFLSFALSRRVFVIFIVSLHALFIGVARI